MVPAFASGQPGWQEILLILVIVLLLFGSRKLPELARSLGRSLSEFKKGREEGTRPTSTAPDAKGASDPASDEERT